MNKMSESPPRPDEPFDQWRKRREHEGARVDLIELYEIVAATRGTIPEALPLAERQELAQRALGVIWPSFQQVAPVRPAERVEMAPYNAGWAQLFATIRSRLIEHLGAVVLRVDHIGSTSIPGLYAKPIIDIQMSVRDVDDEAAYLDGCVASGFELYSRDAEHRFFHVPPPAPRVAQLHVCQSGGPFEREHLLFRDYLRSNARARDRYATTKNAAALRWGEDRIAYTYAKNNLIMDLLEEAETWARASGWDLAHSLM